MPINNMRRRRIFNVREEKEKKGEKKVRGYIRKKEKKKTTHY